MDYKKTGRLIRKKRLAKGLTIEKLAELFGISSQAVGAWERGESYPDYDNQKLIFQILDLNPVELFTGLEIFDEDLKKGISDHIRRMDEKTPRSIMTLIDIGNEEGWDLSEILKVTKDKNGELSDKWIPIVDYYNLDLESKDKGKKEKTKKSKETNNNTDDNVEDLIIEENYNPLKVYMNHHGYIFVVPVEILVKMGKPLFFEVVHEKEFKWVGLRFTDELKENGFDIPEEVYNGKWKGIHIFGFELSDILRRIMGIRSGRDLIEATPTVDSSRRVLILRLDAVRRVNVNIDDQSFLLPKIQDDLFHDDDEEEDDWDE